MKKLASYTLLVLIMIACFFGLWGALLALGVQWLPPFSQPVTHWYEYEPPPKWFIIPAGLLAVVLWAVLGTWLGWASWTENDGKRDE